MTREVIVVQPELTLVDAWSIMKRERVRHLPVVRAGKLLGILSDRDVLLRATARDEGEPTLPADLIVGLAMTPAPFVCGVSTSVDEIVRVMVEKKIDSMPVVSDDDRLVGLVTTTDLILLLVTKESSEKALPFEFDLREVESGATA